MSTWILALITMISVASSVASHMIGRNAFRSLQKTVELNQGTIARNEETIRSLVSTIESLRGSNDVQNGIIRRLRTEGQRPSAGFTVTPDTEK